MQPAAGAGAWLIMRYSLRHVHFLNSVREPGQLPRSARRQQAPQEAARTYGTGSGQRPKLPKALSGSYCSHLGAQASCSSDLDCKVPGQPFNIWNVLLT